MMNNKEAEILGYYGAGIEAQRLNRGIGKIEWLRTREILTKVLPDPPAVIYDVGGGTGVYSFWLASLGYQVYLYDLTPENIALANQFQRSQPRAVLAGCEVADGRCLNTPDTSADVVLEMGPLYHLVDREDRLSALKEASRVLKPGGLIAAAAISHFGSTLYGLSTYGLSNRLMDEPEFMTMVLRELADGQHIRPEKYPNFIARAFFHRPEELKVEMDEAGFCGVEILAVEGPGWFVPTFDQLWAPESSRESILSVVRAVEKEPSLLGFSPHLLALGRKS